MKELIKNLNNNSNVSILKQDKVCAIATYDRNYFELCFNIPDSDQFKSYRKLQQKELNPISMKISTNQTCFH